MRAPTRTAIIFTVIATLLAGCGGISKQDYERQVSVVAENVSMSLDTFNDVQPTPQDMRTAARSLETAADELDDIEPPSEVDSAHEGLAKGVRSLGEIMNELAPITAKALDDPSQIKKADAERLQEIQTKATETLQNLDDIQQEFKAAGYDLGFSSEDD